MVTCCVSDCSVNHRSNPDNSPFYRAMNKLTTDDFKEMEHQLRDCVEKDRRYWQVNDVKCDAIYTAKTYEEFADRVAAAHLRPMDKKDFNQKATLAWNKFATKEKNDE